MESLHFLTITFFLNDVLERMLIMCLSFKRNMEVTNLDFHYLTRKKLKGKKLC